MGFRDEYNFDYLINEAERLVIEELERQLKDRDDVCTCEECALDMVAYTLNNVKPCYRVSLMGSLYARSMENTDYAKDLKRKVSEAIQKISSNPSHD